MTEQTPALADLAAELDRAPVAAVPAAKPPVSEDMQAALRAQAKAADRRAAGEEDPEPAPPPRPAEGQDGSSGKPPRPRGEIWDGCPVRPLGVNGKTSYYLDIHGQMRAVEKHDQQTIMHLFGHMIPRLFLNFPQWDAKAEAPKKGRFDANNAAAAMIQACSERGLFDPDGAVRGVGAWVDDDGRLVYHTGDALLVAGKAQRPSDHQGRIYPAYPPIPHPADRADSDAAAKVLERLSTWRWTRPEIDPVVMLGYVCAQMMGGALAWRPTIWITGPRAAGKSSLQSLMLHLHGGEKGLIQSNDATKSGLTSRIGHSSLPVALDELEPGDERSTKEKDIITLARVASSGGQWYRGSADQKGAGGNVYSTFLFSSILIPGQLNTADLSRLIMLNLEPFEEGTKAPILRADQWRKAGAVLKRTLIDRWPSWAERLDLWREAFGEHGIGGRNADNWATILAMADMAQNAALPSADVLAGWAAKVAGWIRADVDEIGTDADEMLLHLLTKPYDIYRRGEQFTIAQWLMAAASLPGAPRALFGSDTPDDKAELAKMCNDKLAKAGLRVIGTGAEAWLFIAAKKIGGLEELFARSQWAGGAWAQSAARVKGAKSGRAVAPRKLLGIQTRGVEVPFTSMPGLMAFPADRVASPAPGGGPGNHQSPDLDGFA